MGALTKTATIEIRIADVDLATKLDALGATIAAVREAHRDVMSPKSWAALHRAQEAIAEAMIYANSGRLLGAPLSADHQCSSVVNIPTAS